jgi:hypothetical protein
LIITSQQIPAGGYPQPKVGFFTRWGLDILFASLFMIGGLQFIVSNRKNRRFLLLGPGFFAIVAGIVFHNSRLNGSYMLLVVGILILAIGIYYYIRQPIAKPYDQA